MGTECSDGGFHEWKTVMTCRKCGIRNEMLNYNKGWNNALDAVASLNLGADPRLEELRK